MRDRHQKNAKSAFIGKQLAKADAQKLLALTRQYESLKKVKQLPSKC